MRTRTRTEWSIQELARSAGTTSRTLRHYGELGLLEPSRVGSNGYRYYDQTSLLRLQRILLLRELGLSLSAIAEVLDGSRIRLAPCTPTWSGWSRSARGSAGRSSRSAPR